MERRSVPKLLASLAVTVSMTACTADQLASLANQVLANADVYLSALGVDGNTAALKVQDLAEVLLNGSGIDLSKLQTGANGQLKIAGLKKGENLLRIKKKGSNDYMTVPVVVNEDGSLTMVQAQAQLDANGNPVEVTGGQADSSGNLMENGFGFKQSGNDLFFRDPRAGNVQQFDLKGGQFVRGQGQQFTDVGSDAFRAGVPKVKLQTDRSFNGQLLRLRIGNNFPPPFAGRLQEGQPLIDLPAFGPQGPGPQGQGQGQGQPGQMGGQPGQPGQPGQFQQQPGQFQQQPMQQQPAPRLMMFGVMQTGTQPPPPPPSGQPMMQPPPGGQQMQPPNAQGQQMANPNATGFSARPQVVFWYRSPEGAFKRVTLELGADVQGPWQNRQGGMQQQPGMQQPGMQQPGMQQPGMMQPPTGTQPRLTQGLFSFGVRQTGTQPPPPPPSGQPGMQPPPPPPSGQPGMQPPPSGQPGMQPPPSGQPGMQPPPGGQQQPGMQQGGQQQPGMQPGGMQQGGQQQPMMQQQRDPFQGYPKLQTIQAKVVSEETATEAELRQPPQGGGQQQGGQPPQGGQQPMGQMPAGPAPQGGTQPPPPPQGGTQPAPKS